MKISLSEIALWKVLFFGLVLGYCLFYAPFGVNETDGGFLTGLAWQVLHGKVLYQDIIYIRPPLPVWMRALEIHWLPEQFGVLGERWIFYAKVGLYSWLAAALLKQGKTRWVLSTFGFLVSVHCYPAMAWHTVDGILFAVLATYLFFVSGAGRVASKWVILSGLSLFCALLCKQSFYPLFPLFAVGFIWYDWRKALLFFGGFMMAFALFYCYLFQHDLVSGFFSMTTASTEGGQAFQHGLLDYCMITPELALPSLCLLAVGWWLYRRNPATKWLSVIWVFWLFALAFSFAAIIWLRQEHTAPFAQSRAMFWVAVLLIFSRWREIKNHRAMIAHPKTLIAALLLSITWSAAISWGYSLPILFATPWIWAAMEVSNKVSFDRNKYEATIRFVLLVVLLLTFRLGYSFVYRDGKRSDMTEPLGAIFPKLSGIYSDAETAARYRDLKALASRYGPNFKVLPAFPQANYLTGTTSPLPFDWVVNRETNGDNALVYKCLTDIHPVILIEKNYLEKLKVDPELEVTRYVFEKGKTVEETPYFIVKRL